MFYRYSYTVSFETIVTVPHSLHVPVIALCVGKYLARHEM